MLNDFFKKSLEEIDAHIEELMGELEAWKTLKVWKTGVVRPSPGEWMPTERVEDDDIKENKKDAHELIIPPFNLSMSRADWMLSLFKHNPGRSIKTNDVAKKMSLFFKPKAGTPWHNYCSYVSSLLAEHEKKGLLYRPNYGCYCFDGRMHAPQTNQPNVRDWLRKLLSSNPNVAYKIRHLTYESIKVVPLKEQQNFKTRYATLSIYLARFLNESFVKRTPPLGWQYAGTAAEIKDTKAPVVAEPTKEVVTYVGWLRDLFYNNFSSPLTRDFIRQSLRDQCDYEEITFSDAEMISALTSLRHQGFIKQISKDEWQLVNKKSEKE